MSGQLFLVKKDGAGGYHHFWISREWDRTEKRVRVVVSKYQEGSQEKLEGYFFWASFEGVREAKADIRRNFAQEVQR